MQRNLVLLTALLALAACAPAPQVQTVTLTPAAAPAREVDAALAEIREEGMRAHIRFLAHDLLEGRAPATRGGELAAQYIAGQYERLGLEAPGGSYFQPVPILGVTPDPASLRLRFSGPRGTLNPTYVEDFVAWTATQQPAVSTEGEVVFVGYGIHAPEQNWDDYEGTDVRGKIVMVLVNDPPATAEEPDLFGGRAMTYYGRWTYKFEEAERRGAVGAILVHTTESAGYGWRTVQSSWTGEQFELPLQGGRSPLALQSWVTQETARRILALGGHDLDALTRAAQSRGFRAVPIGVRTSFAVRSSMRRQQTPNVVGLLRGRTDEVVTYSAHYDHLGIGPAMNGDSIYNGAEDNASGVALMLTVAAAFARLGERPQRSILFIATTAEESGLLGAHHYVRNPLFPVERTVANINLDLPYFLGPARDVTQIGGDRSTLGEDLEAVLAQRGLGSTGDAFPERGTFFRSDHFPFALMGIPALYLKSGTDIIGQPQGWAEEQIDEYTARRYHQPSDVFREDWDYRGVVQLGEVAFLVGLRVANADTRPAWHPTSEFQRR